MLGAPFNEADIRESHSPYTKRAEKRFYIIRESLIKVECRFYVIIDKDGFTSYKRFLRIHSIMNDKDFIFLTSTEIEMNKILQILPMNNCVHVFLEKFNKSLSITRRIKTLERHLIEEVNALSTIVEQPKITV
jgi:hypothetical protein